LQKFEAIPKFEASASYGDFRGFFYKATAISMQRLNGPDEKAEMRQFGDFKLDLSLWILGVRVKALPFLRLDQYEIKQTEQSAPVEKERWKSA
jgi:hypothetical protein